MVISMYETLLDSIKNHFHKAKRTNGEIKDKLQELFEDNIADYDKFASWYDESKPTISVIAKAEYEHYVVEDFKKLMYGGDYDVKPFEWYG